MVETMHEVMVQMRSAFWMIGLVVACGGDPLSTMAERNDARKAHAGAETHATTSTPTPNGEVTPPEADGEAHGGMGMQHGGMGMQHGGMGMQHGGMGMQHAGPSSDDAFRSSQFVDSRVCASCHDGIRDGAGNDVSIRGDWAATMMANATRDPFWRAKVRSELERSPSLANEIGEECTRCHAPMAHVEAHAAGLPARVFDDGFLHPDNPNHAAALDAVSCTLCHRIADDPSLGRPESFTGGYVLAEEPVLFGPYEDVFTMPMQHMVGFTPTYGPQTKRSELCATCHNLKTPVTDATGRIVRAGPVDGFPEQMPYTEWLASAHVNRQSCQDCHMGRTDGVVLSTRPPWLAARDDFALHGFAGGNRLMLGILQTHREELGVGADVDFTRVLRKTERLLASAATIGLTPVRAEAGVLEVRVRVQNFAGHKLPTSFPSRRVYVQFTVAEPGGRILFESGRARADGSLEGDDAGLAGGARFEPHHDRIEDASQVQIYESVMGDLEGRPTYTLLRGAVYLKDNRVLPAGAIKSTLPADIAVAGDARNDENFVGGSDEVTYRVAGLSPGTRVQVKAALHYQPLAAPFAADLFQDQTAEARTFERMFEAAPAKTFALAETAAELDVPR